MGLAAPSPAAGLVGGVRYFFERCVHPTVTSIIENSLSRGNPTYVGVFPRFHTTLARQGENEDHGQKRGEEAKEWDPQGFQETEEHVRASTTFTRCGSLPAGRLWSGLNPVLGFSGSLPRSTCGFPLPVHCPASPREDFLSFSITARVPLLFVVSLLL